MLWLALYLPKLPIECVPDWRSLSQPDPAIVVAQLGRREKVVAANIAAEQCGIHAGMSRQAAEALAGKIHIRRRDHTQESESLSALAAWSLQFTPTVAIDPAPAVLLEIGGCLRYFGGIEALRRLILNGLDELGYSHHHAFAPTPLAALWLAHWQPGVIVNNTEETTSTLYPAPIALLCNSASLDERQQKQLQHLGIRHLGQLAALPRTGISHRLGPQIFEILDRATGANPDPRNHYEAPDQFSRRIELDWPADHADALLFVCKRQLVELSGFLLARGAGVEQVTLKLDHDDHPPTLLTCGFGQRIRDSTIMVAVLREQVTSHTLVAPARAITLQAENLQALASLDMDLFGYTRPGTNLALLKARLQARLGADAVRRLSIVDDHRPEKAWSSLANTSSQSNTSTPHNIRPGWLLLTPEPLEMRGQRLWRGSMLTIRQPAERIEAGWWDGEPVQRDYYRAEDQHGQSYWIYHDLHDGQWWLHGLFA